jgi:hypothetical protein
MDDADSKKQADFIPCSSITSTRAPEFQEYVWHFNTACICRCASNACMCGGLKNCSPSSSCIESKSGASSATASSQHSQSHNTTNPARFTLSQGKFVKELQLCAIELPLCQYTIEDDWNRIYMNEGFAFRTDNERVLSLSFPTQISTSSSGCGSTECAASDVSLPASTTRSLLLPLTLNPIVSITGSDLTGLTDLSRPVFTTLYEHGLSPSILSAWSLFGGTIQLIAVGGGLSPTETVLNGHNAERVEILSPTMFRLNLATPLSSFPMINPDTSSGFYGYLYASPIPSPDFLATILSRAIESITNSQIHLAFCNDRFVLQGNALPGSLLLDTCLSRFLGFNTNQVLVPLPKCVKTNAISNGNLRRIQCFRIPTCQPFSPPCDFLCLNVNNYSADSMASELNLQLNRFYFDPGCPPLPNPPVSSEIFVWNDACGVCHSVNIPFGQYTPDSLADFLQESMNAEAAGSADVYQVTFVNNRFEFSSNDNSPFSLEFNQTSASSLATRLGFFRLSYRGCSFYRSEMTICYWPHQNIYTVLNNPSQSRFIFHAAAPRCISTVTITQPTPPDGSLLVSTAPVSNAFAIDDVVSISCASQTYLVRVLNVLSRTSFTIDTASLDTSAIACFLASPVSAASPACVCPVGCPMFNIFLTGCRAVKPEILGLDPITSFQIPSPSICSSSGDPSTHNNSTYSLVGARCYNLEHPPFLLVEILSPAECSQSEYNNQPVFSKLSLYPSYKFEKGYNSRILFGTPQQLSYVEVRIVNPDLTPYHFHGRNWSGTFCLLIQSNRPTLHLYKQCL